MKIAMLSPYALSRVGGVQGQVVGLSRALGTMGHDVTVLGPSDRGAALPTGLGPHYVFGHCTGVRANGSVAPVALSPLAAARVERFVRHGHFDVVHVHEPLAPVAAYGLILRRPVPLVGTYHRSGVGRGMTALTPLTRYVSRRLQVRVAVSAAARETAVRSGGGTFEVLFNGIDVDRFTAASPLREDRGRPVVLFLGRHETRKGLEVLLEAFCLLEGDVVLWVVGEGPATASLRHRYPQSDRLRWLGTLRDDEVASRLTGADVLCAPSLHGESFGVVLLEGMAAGCSIVASDIDGYRDAAAGHAVLVPPGDPLQLARALEAVLAEVAAGSGLASPEGRGRALEHARGWSMRALAERYAALYARAVDTFSAGARGRPSTQAGGSGATP